MISNKHSLPDMLSSTVNKRGFCIWLITCLIIVGKQDVMAQKSEDTLAQIREFVTISNGYKQTPLYLDLEMKSTTNFFTGYEDTSMIRAQFYLKDDHSYIRFGELEQLVNDSLALLVSDNLRRMILYTDAEPVAKKAKEMMGMGLPDSSARKLATRYQSSKKQLSPGSSMIELSSRAVLYGTSLSKETIELQYDVSKKTPQRVATLSRSLIPLDADQYQRLQAEKNFANNLLTIEGNYFLVKEQVIEYIYKRIDHSSSAKVPVQISDRINKNNEGEYDPVKNYASYRLTVND